MKYMHIPLAVVLTLSVTLSVQADPPDTEAQIKYRQSAMMFLRWNIGTIKDQVIKRPQTYNADEVRAAAQAIAAIAHTNLEALFSADSATGKGWKATRVKAAYFKEPAEVEQRYRKLREQADALAAVAGSGDLARVKVHFEDTLNACKGCHKAYRAK